MRRRTDGQETWHRLRDWSKGQAASERLAAQILLSQGFAALDPAHPLGGRDKLLDVLCQRDGQTWRAASYFPRGQKAFAAIEKKFIRDLNVEGDNRNHGYAFITNQELRLSERKKLSSIPPGDVDIFHLERLSTILNQPAFYGVRLEFLDITMSKEEQLSFFAELVKSNTELRSAVLALATSWKESEFQQRLEGSVPLDELRAFSSLLGSITGSIGSGVFTVHGTIRDLYVPLAEMREFSALLKKVTGHPDSGVWLTSGTVHGLYVPVEELREFIKLLNQICSPLPMYRDPMQPSMRDLDVPLDAMREYVSLLDLALQKAEKLRQQQP